MNDKHPLDIPDFLKLTDAERKAAWHGWRAPRTRAAKAAQDYTRPRTWSPEAEQLARQIEREQAEKQKARLAALRERKTFERRV